VKDHDKGIFLLHFQTVWIKLFLSFTMYEENRPEVIDGKFMEKA
jgi:hypothetical protein